MKGTRYLSAWLVIGLFLSFSITQAATIIVKSDGSGDFPTIQAAIDAAVGRDIIQVEEGTYTGDGNRDIDFKGKAITVRGNVSDPNLVVIDCQGTEAEPHRGFRFVGGEDPNSILEGFTITNGYGPPEDPENDSFYYSHGGGAYCFNSSPSIRSCIFKNNSARYGGGISIYSCQPFLSACDIGFGSAIWGGGVYAENSSSVLDHCFIHHNSKQGICYNGNGHSVITNCVITYNTSTSGGGVCNLYSSRLSISKSLIRHNTATENGGGVHNNQGTLTVDNSCFTDNTAEYGGGLNTHSHASTTIKNSTFCKNSASIQGSGIYVQPYDNHVEAVNSIVWGNYPDQIGGNAAVFYSDIQGGYSGIGNMDIDPKMDESCRLLGTSPCIDSGDPNYIPYVNETDIDGHPRMVNDRIDIGADEFYSDSSALIGLRPFEWMITTAGKFSQVPPQDLSIRNYGVKPLLWQIDIPTGCQWLTAKPMSGQSITEPNEVILTIDPVYADYGFNTCQFTVSDPLAGNSPQVVTMMLDVLRPEIAILPTSIGFTCDIDEPNVPAQTVSISNSGYDTLNWQTAEDCDWLSVEPISGQCITDSNEVVLTVTPEGLEIGYYDCELTISDENASNSPRTVPVSLHVYRAGERHVPTEYPTIQEAIDAAADGDHVIVHPGIYNERFIRLQDKQITIRSLDPSHPEIVESTIFKGYLLFDQNNTFESVVDGITIDGQVSVPDGNPTLRNCIFVFEGNFHTIYANGGSPQIYNCSFVGIAGACRGYGIAIQIYNNRNSAVPARVDHCLISVKLPADNYSISFGPAVGITNGSVEITNTILAYNDMFVDISPPGSALLIDRSDVTLKNSIVFNNPAMGNMEIAVINHSSDPADPLNSHLDISYSLYYGGQEKILLCPSPQAYELYRDHGILPDPSFVAAGTLIWGPGNIEVDPLFAREPDDGGDGWLDNTDTPDVDESVNNDYGDLHLKSQAGRFVWDGLAKADFNMDRQVNLEDFAQLALWWKRTIHNYPHMYYLDIDRNYFINLADLTAFVEDYLRPRVFGAWVTDEVTSPCIDAGDPNDPGWRNELWPHGKRINIGAYGGTPQASMSPNPAGNVADLNHDDMVDLADWALWADDWMLEKVLMDSDLDRDNDIDIEDLVIFAAGRLWSETD